jgi:4-amino-4-deoxy-L-arabinose transferase-like glycosyltransferase
MLLEPWVRNWDEAWYAEIIKNMAVKDYGWLMPWWNGRYYFDHPPLYFWLSGVVVKLFGLGEWQVRIVAILAGLGVVWLTYKLGGKVAALVLLSTAQVIVRFSHGNLDSLMIFLFLLTFYWWLKDKWVWAGIALGLGFLVKGWLLGMFPVAVILIYRHKLEVKKLAGLMAIAIAVFGLWVIPAGIKFGQPMIDRYLWQADAGRLSRPTAMWSLKFFEYLVRDLGLWIIPGLLMVTKKRRKVLPFLVTSFGFIFGLSFLDEKSDWYLLPVYPLLAISVGRVANSWNKLVIAGLVIIGLINAYRVEMMYPDRSAVGAALGRYAKNIIPWGETVVLDDHDFTAFLYYLDHEMVYVVEQQPKKANEWWRVEYDELPRFIEEKEVVWLVTPKPMIDWPGVNSIKVSEYQGYNFWRIARRSG